MLIRNPAFTLVAALTLALGIGANAAIFSVMNAVLLRRLPYPEPERLVMLWQDLRAQGGPADEWATPGNFFDWVAQRDVFESLATIAGWGPSLTSGAGPEQLSGAQVSHEYFAVLGIPPLLGRGFLPEEDRPQVPRVTVLSHALWQQRFGGDPGIVGRPIMLSGEPHTVVGVMPPGFRPMVLEAAELWRPLRLTASNPSRGAVVLRVIGRLRAGVDRAEAASRLDALARRLETEHPRFNTGVRFALVPLQEQLVRDVRPGLLALAGAVGFVLLIACANVANLLLARASTRTHEIAVRLALGAAPRRIVRQLLTESLMLAGVGAAFGLLLASWGVAALSGLMPGDGSTLRDVPIDVRVVGFTAIATLATGLLFGLAPALQVSRQRAELHQGGRGGTGAPGGRLRGALVVGEVAVTLMLLVGAGLLMRSFIQLRAVDLGFDTTNVLTGGFLPPPAKYMDRAQLVTLYDRVLERVKTLPGVEVAALASVIPLQGAGSDSDTTIFIEGRPAPRTGADQAVAWYRLVSAEYFAALRIPPLRGRVLDAHEPAPVIVVNETMAQRYWPGEDAVGRRISTDGPDGPWRTIVGVVPDARPRGPAVSPQVEMYVPYGQMPERGMNVILRAARDPLLLTSPLKAAVRDVDPDLPVANIATLDARLSDTLAEPRFLTLLLGIFAAVAAILAAAGIYGVMMYTVSQRTKEIGVRIALGARPGDVMRLVLGQALLFAGFGVALGAAGALATGSLIQGLLFGVAPRDPVTFVIMGAATLMIVLAAGYVPSRRAVRVDPMVALRVE
jgi:putative ABC transport system permease protein